MSRKKANNSGKGRKQAKRPNGTQPSRALVRAEPALATVPDKKELFLSLFEETCGNISATCEIVGIDRGTYYNWMAGTKDTDLEFQSRIKEMRADERFIDIAEHSILQAVKEGDVDATKFVLKTKGKHRGWTDRLPHQENGGSNNTVVIVDMGGLLDRVATAYQNWLHDHPAATEEERRIWLGRFAANGKVSPAELAQKVGVISTDNGGN